MISKLFRATENVDSHKCPGGTWHIKRKRQIFIYIYKYSKLTSNQSEFNKSTNLYFNPGEFIL